MKAIVFIAFVITLVSSDDTSDYQPHLTSAGVVNFLVSKFSTDDESTSTMTHFFPGLMSSNSTNVTIILQSQYKTMANLKAMNLTAASVNTGNMNGTLTVNQSMMAPNQDVYSFCVNLTGVGEMGISNQTNPARVSVNGTGQLVISGEKCGGKKCKMVLRVNAMSSFRKETVAANSTVAEVTDSSCKAVVQVSAKGNDTLIRIYATGVQMKTISTMDGGLTKNATVEMEGAASIKLVI